MFYDYPRMTLSKSQLGVFIQVKPTGYPRPPAVAVAAARRQGDSCICSESLRLRWLSSDIYVKSSGLELSRR